MANGREASHGNKRDAKKHKKSATICKFRPKQRNRDAATSGTSPGEAGRKSGIDEQQLHLKERVVLKVIASAWASDVAAGNKLFECVANRKRWQNQFKGLKKGDLFAVLCKGTLQVAAVCEIASPPQTKVQTREALYSLVLPEQRAAINSYLGDAATFDYVPFSKIYSPPSPLTIREMLGILGAEIPKTWQGVQHIKSIASHARLCELIGAWPCHVKDA